MCVCVYGEGVMFVFVCEKCVPLVFSSVCICVCEYESGCK